jgi:hypothetical protein
LLLLKQFAHKKRHQKIVNKLLTGQGFSLCGALIFIAYFPLKERGFIKILQLFSMRFFPIVLTALSKQVLGKSTSYDITGHFFAFF